MIASVFDWISPVWFAAKDSAQKKISRVSDAAQACTSFTSSIFQRVQGKIEDNLFVQPSADRWKDLSTALVPLVAGIIASPHVAYGVGTAAVLIPFRKQFVNFLYEHIENPSPSEYEIENPHLFHKAISRPFFEELQFRGLLQPLLIWATGSSVLGILGSAICFGYAHLANEHANTHIQAINSCVGGIVYGLLKEQFGFLSAFAAHTTWNLRHEFEDLFKPD